MNVSTEREWQAARKELLAAERELEEHAKRVVEGSRPVVPIGSDSTDWLRQPDGCAPARSRETAGGIPERSTIRWCGYLRRATQALTDRLPRRCRLGARRGNLAQGRSPRR
jgi:hypothetical protein